jgi:hypothetical protein
VILDPIRVLPARLTNTLHFMKLRGSVIITEHYKLKLQYTTIALWECFVSSLPSDHFLSTQSLSNTGLVNVHDSNFNKLVSAPQEMAVSMWFMTALEFAVIFYFSVHSQK